MALTVRLRALWLLARYPDGCAAYGFTIDFLAGPVSDGVITAESSTMHAGGRPVILVWLQAKAGADASRLSDHEGRPFSVGVRSR
jgi:hypothetical protein